MRYRGICCRAHDPRWAWAPLSGEGARLRGGRFNPVGMPALYLSLDPDTAVIEARGGLRSRLQPLLLCPYEADIDGVIDLRDGPAQSAAGVTGAELSCSWLADHAAGRIPASWALVRRLTAAGASGILVPSFAYGAGGDAANLVLWIWGPDPPHRVAPDDPDGRLPKNADSWA